MSHLMKFGGTSMDEVWGEFKGLGQRKSVEVNFKQSLTSAGCWLQFERTFIKKCVTWQVFPQGWPPEKNQINRMKKIHSELSQMSRAHNSESGRPSCLPAGGTFPIMPGPPWRIGKTALATCFLVGSCHFAHLSRWPSLMWKTTLKVNPTRTSRTDWKKPQRASLKSALKRTHFKARRAAVSPSGK